MFKNWLIIIDGNKPLVVVYGNNDALGHTTNTTTDCCGFMQMGIWFVRDAHASYSTNLIDFLSATQYFF